MQFSLSLAKENPATPPRDKVVMLHTPRPNRDFTGEFRARLPAYDGPPLYLIACAPKSGSTYAAAILNEYLGSGQFFAGKVPNRAAQELDAVWIDDEVAAGNTVIHQHVPWHETTKLYVESYKIRPIFLVRDLADTIASIRDHLRSEKNGNWPGAHIDNVMIERSDAELEEAISCLIMPWYFTFFAGWRESGFPMLTYDELIADPTILFRKLDFPGEAAQFQSAINAAGKRPTRRNFGAAGRGKQISPHALLNLNRLASHYRHIDLTPIMGEPYKT